MSGDGGGPVVSVAEDFSCARDGDWDEMFAALSDAERETVLRHWDFWRRDGQRAPVWPWRVWLIMAGRGMGKTRMGAEWIRALAESNGTLRLALVGATIEEARRVMVEGESGLLAIAESSRRPVWEPSLNRLRWPSGAVATVFSAENPEALRGPQHHYAWCDEIAKWNNGIAAWDNLLFGMRRGALPRIVATTTPRAVPLMRRLLGEPGVAKTFGRSEDNSSLPQSYLDTLTAIHGNSRIGRQEMGGELIEDIEGALWTRAMIEAARWPTGCGLASAQAPFGLSLSKPSLSFAPAPEEENGASTGSARTGEGEALAGDRDVIAPCSEFVRVVIGVDPPASAQGDACGIVAVGLDAAGRGHVIEDASVEKASPQQWARAVAACAARHEADRVVAEVNNGGDMVGSVLRGASVAMPVKQVRASRGKSARAEPVAALYGHGRVFHRGAFPALEDQMCGMLAGGGYEGPGRSPDRADALVWALTELMLGVQRTARGECFRAFAPLQLRLGGCAAEPSYPLP